MSQTKRILVIQKDNSLSGNGGSVLSRRNTTFLKKIYGEENVDVAYILRPSFLDRVLGVVFNKSYGKFANFTHLLNTYDFSKCQFVFIDASLEGELVKKLYDKKVVTIVFYHNIEYIYYSDLYSSNHSLLSLVMKIYSYRQEKMSSLYSSFRFVLNERDARDLERIYKKQSDLLLPTSFDRIDLPENRTDEYVSYHPYALFVGSNFFANAHGLSWFIENVLPTIKLNLVVAGSISDFVKKKYTKLPSNLFVLGFVDDLLPLYVNATCVVSPIFLGSGLKTKTIEALMYGKKIIGSTEAFQGVNVDFNQVGALCNTQSEFISSLNSFAESDSEHTFNQYSYVFFCKNFSTEVSLNHLKTFLTDHNLL